MPLKERDKGLGELGGVKEQELLTGRRASSVGVACGRGRSQISSGQERPTGRFQRWNRSEG